MGGEARNLTRPWPQWQSPKHHILVAPLIHPPSNRLAPRWIQSAVRFPEREDHISCSRNLANIRRALYITRCSSTPREPRQPSSHLLSLVTRALPSRAAKSQSAAQLHRAAHEAHSRSVVGK